MSQSTASTKRRPGSGRSGRRRGFLSLGVGLGIGAGVVVASLVLLQVIGVAPAAFFGGDAAGTGSVTRETSSALALKGKRYITPADRRARGPSIRIQTASFGDGSTFDLARERNNVVILYFMAAWCTTCIPEARALADLHETYKDRGVRILEVGVDQQETEDQLAGFRRRAGKGRHLWALDAGYGIVRPYNVRSLDTTIIIDQRGRVAYRDARPTSYDTLAAVVEAVMAEAAAGS